MCRRCVLLVALVMLAWASELPAWGGSATIIYVSATASQNGDGSITAPLRTVEDAIALARSRPIPSVIQILPGRYSIHGSLTGPDDRIIVDVPNLTIQGSNQMVFSNDGFPSGVQAKTETLLFADPPLTGNQAIIKVAAANVTIKNLSLDGRTSPSELASHSPLLLGGDAAVFVLAQNATVESNIMTGAFLGLDFSGSGTIQGNLFTKNMGAGCAVGPAAVPGPPNVNIRGNRSDGNFLAALALNGNNVNPGFASLLVVDVDGNDLTGGTASGFGSGIRIFPIGPGPDPAPLGAVTARIHNNHIHGNFFSVVVDGGFPFRASPNSWSGQLDLAFDGNQVADNANGPLISFTRFTAFLDPSQLSAFKYLESSSFTIKYSDDSFDGVVVDDPAVDPISGDVLGNSLVVQNI